MGELERREDHSRRAFEEIMYENHNGLIVDKSTTPPTCAGYIFNFGEHGAFAPDGKIPDLIPEQIDAHNNILAKIELEAFIKNGKGTFYHFRKDGYHFVGMWAGEEPRFPATVRFSHHNFAGKNGRRDFWFTINGQKWHGVNIGDNDIVRAKRLK